MNLYSGYNLYKGGNHERPAKPEVPEVQESVIP